jgi:hypothetical protein
MREKKQKKLSCGAVGCCHIALPHHHCENCGETVYEVHRWDFTPYRPIAPYAPYWYSSGNSTGVSSPNSVQTWNGDSSPMQALSADCTH